MNPMEAATLPPVEHGAEEIDGVSGRLRVDAPRRRLLAARRRWPWLHGRAGPKGVRARRVRLPLSLLSRISKENPVDAAAKMTSKGR